MITSKARIIFVVYCLAVSLLACQRETSHRARGDAAVPSEIGQSLIGSVDLLGNYVIDLPAKFIIEGLDLQDGVFYFGNSQLFIYLSVTTASTKEEGERWRRQAKEDVTRFERNEVFSKNGLDYYGSYAERVDPISHDHGFDAYVFKGKIKLYMNFIFCDDSSLITARKIWMSSR
jgi:hypothetical protein